MGDAAAAGEPEFSDRPEQPSGHRGQERRRTIDLVRVERGEPERRNLNRERRDTDGSTPPADSE